MSSTPARKANRGRVIRRIGIIALVFMLLLGGDLAVLVRQPERVPVKVAQPADGVATWVVVGLDSLTDGTPGAEERKASQPGSRADIIIVIRQTADQVVAFTINRDLVIREPNSSPRRLTLTWLDGPQQFVDALCTNLQIPVTHLVAINMTAFTRLVDGLGGVQIDVPRALRDPKAHIQVAAGQQVMDGKTALGYVRSRQGQVQIDGSWVDEEQGASGRQRRGSAVFAAVTAKARQANWLTLHNVSWQVLPLVALDDKTSLLELARVKQPTNIAELPSEQTPGAEIAEITAQTRQALIAFGYGQSCSPVR